MPSKGPRTALLLVAHGSREQEANADLLHVVEQLAQGGRYDYVQPSFLELAEPTIVQGAECCVQQGAERVILLPYFLSAGVHVRRAGSRWRFSRREGSIARALFEGLAQERDQLGDSRAGRDAPDSA